MYERKADFLEWLGNILRDFSREPVEKIDYDAQQDCALIKLRSGNTEKVNIACDSCVAAMIDIGQFLLGGDE